MRYRADGLRLSALQFGGTGDDAGIALVSQSNGGAVVVGDATAAIDGQTFSGETDFFLSAIGASDQGLWTRMQGTAEAEEAFCAWGDAAGAVYFAGMTMGAMDAGLQQGAGDAVLVKTCPSSP